MNDEDIELVQVDPFSAGYFDREVEKGRRLVSAVSYWRKDIKDNGYAHPIEGVVALVDLIENKIVHLVDEPDIIPIPKKSRNYDRASIPQTRNDVKPLDVVQKDGPSFTVEGWKVDWQNWSFRVGWTAREGLVLHQIAFRDGERERPIIYRASVTDMIVPYADPTANHFWKCAFDAGEYGLGKLANALELGCDCLGHIHYFDVPVADDYGKPAVMKNAICLHEEDYGILWKHYEFRNETFEVRRSRRLVDLVLHDRWQLRLRLLLVFLSGRHHSARSQAHRHHPDRGDCAGQALSVGRHGRRRSRRSDPPAFLQCPPAHDARRRGQYRHRARVPAAAVGQRTIPMATCSIPRARVLARERDAAREADGRTGRYWKITNPNKKNSVGGPTGLQARWRTARP